MPRRHAGAGREYQGAVVMVERSSELTRRYHRKKKMKKLKLKLAKATAGKDGREREKILGKIRHLSPFWEEPAPASN
jgi:hypothetical protein